MGQNEHRELSKRTVLRDPLLYLLEGLVDNGPGQQQEHGTSGWQYHHRRRRHFSSSRMSLQMSAH